MPAQFPRRRPQLPTAMERRAARLRFVRARRVEVTFRKQLTNVSRHIGKLVSGFVPRSGETNITALRTALQNYSNVLRPWASSIVSRMHAEVGLKDLQAWMELGKDMGQILKREILKAPTGIALQKIMAEQVTLITSLPLEAAQRVHTLAQKGITESERADVIRKDILRTGQVTVGRARTIARTEVARTASVLTESRAKFVGSPGYYWRTSEDSDVRPLHKKLNGKFIKWDDPPIAGENGERAHAGQIYS